MAKTIKFNLKCDRVQARTLEDVRENFSVEDMLHYFKNGLLEKWMQVRGFSNELERLRQIKEDSDEGIVKALAKLFDVEVDDDDVGRILSDWKEWTEEKESKRSSERAKELEQPITQKALDEYFADYQKYKNLLCGAGRNIFSIRNALGRIANDYYRIFEIDYSGLFNELLEKSPYALMVLMGYPKLQRKYATVDSNSGESYVARIHGLLKAKGTDSVQQIAQIKDLFGEKVKVFKSSDQAETPGAWCQIVEKGKRCIILHYRQIVVSNRPYARSVFSNNTIEISYPSSGLLSVRPAEGDMSTNKNVSDAISMLHAFDGLECVRTPNVGYEIYYLEI